MAPSGLQNPGLPQIRKDHAQVVPTVTGSSLFRINAISKSTVRLGVYLAPTMSPERVIDDDPPENTPLVLAASWKPLPWCAAMAHCGPARDEGVRAPSIH